MTLGGRVVVVTGASSGIGARLALSLGKRGARVVLAARRADRLEQVAALIRAGGGAALAVPTDVTLKQDLQALVERVAKEHGRCDVLVNNAGIPGGGRFAELPLADLERVTATNYLSVLRLTKLFLPMLVDAGGHVVNVASLAGRFAIPGAAAYTASKHAVVALSESLGYAETGVAFTVVNPGLTRTEGFPMTQALAHPILRHFVMEPGRVASEITRAIELRREGEINIPRWLATFQLARLLVPPLYREVVGRLARTQRISGGHA